MKRALLVLLFVAGLVAILDPASAGFCPRCGPYQNTTNYWAMGPSCAEAIQQAQSWASAEISCAYGTCSEQFVVVASCMYNMDHWEVLGYVRYRCALDTSGCIEPYP